jgi:hypothetical protein
MKASDIRILIISFVATILALSSGSVLAAPISNCSADQNVRKGSPALSSETANPDEIGEKIGIRLRICVPNPIPVGGKIEFSCSVAKLLIPYTNNEGKLTLSNPSKMPPELRQARELALAGDPESQEPGEVTGSIPKLLMPGYKQENDKGVEVDPKIALTKAEGQLVQGWVVENQLNKQKKVKPALEELVADGDPTEDDPYYDVRVEGQETKTQVGEENYELEGTFGEVAPLYDRYGLLAQAVSFPTDEPLELPDVNCPAATSDPRQINLLESLRKVIWRAAEKLKPETSKEECDVDDLGCLADLITPDVDYLIAKGDLDIQSKVSLAGDAWNNMAGANGAFSTLLPPGTVFKSEDNEKPAVSFAQIGGKTSFLGLSWKPFSNDGTSIMKIASLGTVGDTVDCLVDGLAAHPANANSAICNEVIIRGAFSGWPTEHGCITQGPRSGTTHKNADAIDIGSNTSVGWAPMGQPAMSTVSGTVEIACNDVGGCGSIATVGSCSGVPSCTGRWVSITPDDGGFKIWYFHLNSVNATGGQRVSPGTVIGMIGTTGNSTGPHLHYEFKTSDMAPPKIPESPGLGLCW